MKKTAAVVAALACMAASPLFAAPIDGAFQQGSADAAAAQKTLKASAQARAKAQAAASRSAGIDWVQIPGTPAGKTFLMGSDNGTSGTRFFGRFSGWSWPAHPVTVASFEMAKTPVTNRQYAACVSAGACTPTKGCDDKAYKGGDKPVVCVTWFQAEAFAAWVGGRLPSEEEYEYAERGAGEPIAYPWGDAKPSCDEVVDPLCGARGPEPVCSKPTGDTRQGLCDMAGNVWEWVADAWHDSYRGAPSDGTAWNGSGERVLRGGLRGRDGYMNLRAASRWEAAPSTRWGIIGFRVAR